MSRITDLRISVAGGTLLAGLLALGSCGSPSLGDVPDELLELCACTSPGGVVGVSVDEDGEVLAVITEFDVDGLPRDIRNAALAAAEGSRIVGASRELLPEGERWRVRVAVGEEEHEYHIDSRNRVRAVEREVTIADVPPWVLEAVERELPGGELNAVFRVRRGGVVEWRARKSRDGAVVEALLASDGRLLRKTKRTRAEIELPVD